VSATGEFVRDTKYLNGRITADGRDGSFPVEAGRYRLVVARACPWANRTMIVRRLLGLEPVLSMGICGPEHDWRSWTFDLDPGEVDPVLGIHFLREAFEKAVPGYDRGVTVPAIVEIASGAVVTADFRQITLDLEHEWTAHHRPGAPDLYPEKLRDEIEEVSDLVYEDLNNGVYRCGFATTQAAYEEAYGKLFARLDWLSERLATRRYLAGDTITEADMAHVGQVRRRLSRPLQVQPEQAVRDAGALGLRPGPVPDARLRRHDQLRPDQTALLPGAHQREPVPDRPGRTRSGELACTAPAHRTRRSAVRRRNAARSAATRGTGDGRTRRLG
jgi:glutathionyl-hydroquinone reductase